MSIKLSDSIRVGQQKPLEDKYFNELNPYTSTNEVNTKILKSVRHIGLTVNINKEEYWYKDGIEDENLVLKVPNTDALILKNQEQDDRLENLEGIHYRWSPTNRALTLFDNRGNLLSQVSLHSLDNEGTDFRYNATTLSLELYNADNELLDSIPVSSFIGSVGTQLQLSSNELQLKDSQGNILSTVSFSVVNISGLQTALYSRLNKGSYPGNASDLKTEIDGKANSSHTHPISEVTNLQTTLDNKVDKVIGKQLSTEDYTTVEKNKLAGIQEGAEVNVNADWNATSGDAQILNKPDLQEKFDNYVPLSGGKMSGSIEFEGYDNGIFAENDWEIGKLFLENDGGSINFIYQNISKTTGQKTSLRFNFNGLSTDTDFSNLNPEHLKFFAQRQYVHNIAETKADLVGGKVPASQLPAYVDDVLEFANLASFPATGESGKIYIAIDTNLTYRWGGSSYVVMSSSLALGETSSTAYRGDRGKIAYDHSQTTGNPHGTTKEDVGLGNVDDTSDLNKPISTVTQQALNNKLDKGGYAGTASDLKTEIDGKASTSHTHNISDVTNLQTALDAKLSIETTSITGAEISFTNDRIYGSLATPETGNITADVTNAKLGVTNIIIHNSGTAPNFGSQFKKLSGSGNYTTGVVNYIYCTFISATEIIYSINQRA